MSTGRTQDERERTIFGLVSVIHRNLVVARPVGFRPLHLDLHVPEGPAPDPGRPVLFWVHGGGWRSGSRLELPETIAPFGFHERLLARGYAVADVDYRLSAEAIFPAQLEDVNAAIAWVAEHAARFGLDRDRFAALGESAGALLAALAGLKGKRLKAVVAWYPPVDLTHLRPPQPGSSEEMLLGGQPADVPELAFQASPVNHAHPASPPFLFVHGTQDRVVPFAQSELLAAALREHGVRSNVIAVPGADHCFEGAEDIGSLIDASIDFLDEVM
jgi:acetyl esterase/lipase